MQCPQCAASIDERHERRHLQRECPTTCPDCGREDLKGAQGLSMHQNRHCPERVLDEADPDSPTRFRVTNAPPAAMPASVRDPGSSVFNVTHAWYLYLPEQVDITGISTTGLPVDMLHSAPSWDPIEVQRQIEQDHILLTPVERYGGKLHGSPYVHIGPPRGDVWAGYARRWHQIALMEIEIEGELLDQAELDLQRATTREDRTNARQRIRVFSTRLSQLRTLDTDRVFGFLVREHELSRQIGRSGAQAQSDLIDERVEAVLGRVFDEHVG